MSQHNDRIQTDKWKLAKSENHAKILHFGNTMSFVFLPIHLPSISHAAKLPGILCQSEPSPREKWKVSLETVPETGSAILFRKLIPLTKRKQLLYLTVSISSRGNWPCFWAKFTFSVSFWLFFCRIFNLKTARGQIVSQILSFHSKLSVPPPHPLSVLSLWTNWF